MVYNLLIIFTDGTDKIIESVSNYGASEDGTRFYYEKNGYRSFLTSHSIRFVGREFDYKEKK